jgi:enoyl-CoA hydratase/carnithine racemase
MVASYPRSLPFMTLVLTEDRGPVRHVILNRPEKRNAFNGELVVATGEALREAAADVDVRCVVVRGEGPMFSSGMDLGSLAALAEAPENLRAFRSACLQAWSFAEEMTKPTVCVIHGACIGGAMELALACDLRVMASDAVVGLPETRIGLIPDVGGSSRLPAVIGLGRAKELIMTGRMVGGEEAERIGLVNRIAPAGAVMTAADALVEELLACAPVAVGLAKRVMDASARPALAATLELEVAMQERCAATADFAEGAQAFRERRQPEFVGR